MYFISKSFDFTKVFNYTADLDEVNDLCIFLSVFIMVIYYGNLTEIYCLEMNLITPSMLFSCKRMKTHCMKNSVEKKLVAACVVSEFRSSVCCSVFDLVFDVSFEIMV